MSEMQHAHEHAAAATVGHETRDASLAWVLGFGVVLTVITIIVLLVLWWMFNYWNPEPPLGHGPLPREPRLEGITPAPQPPHEQPAAEVVPHEYGWVDREGNVARIPVDKAMNILTHRPDLVPAAPAAGRTPEEAQP